MILYLLLLLVPIIAFCSQQQTAGGYIRKDQTRSVEFLAMFMTCLAFFVGFGDMLGGYDRYIYAELFDDVADTMRGGGSFMQTSIVMLYTKELGYDALNLLISYITANRYIFILIVTLIIYALVFASFRRYMTNYPFAMVMFMGLWFFFTFTYLRQVLAASVAWLSIKYIVERKPWKFFAIIILAFSIHNSALLLIPFYFLPIRKYPKSKVLMLMAICLVVGLSGVTTDWIGAYGDATDQQGRFSAYEEQGSRLAYAVEAAFFLYFIMKNYDHIPNDKTRLLLCNMALAFCAILLFFIRSENGGRLSWFFMVGLISTITYMVTSGPKWNDQSVVVFVVCVLLFLRILIAWNMLLYPYKTFFTDGYRKGDVIHEKYEYDSNYDIDKFYR